MAQERIELRITPGSPGEQALIDALDALGGEYGAKGRFLKERLLTGYQVILGELEGFMREDNPMAALDRYGSRVDAKHYRVLKVFLIAALGRPGGAERNTAPPSRVVPTPTTAVPAAALPEPQPGQPEVEPPALSLELAVPAVQLEVEVQPVELSPNAVPVEPTNAPDCVPVNVLTGSGSVLESVPVDPENVTGSVPTDPENVTGSVPTDPENVTGSVPTEPEVRKPHNWSAFAGIAGVAKKGV